MQKSHKFSLFKPYSRYASDPVSRVRAEARRIARQANQIVCAEHLLLALMDDGGANWMQFSDLLIDKTIERENIIRWIDAQQPDTTDDSVSEAERIEAVLQHAYETLKGQQRHFCLNTGYLILGLLNLDAGFLADFFRQHGLNSVSIRDEFQQKIRQEPLPFPLEDELLAFLHTQTIDIRLQDESTDDAISLTIPAITLVQELLETFRSSEPGARDALVQKQHQQTIQIRIRSEAPDT